MYSCCGEWWLTNNALVQINVGTLSQMNGATFPFGLTFLFGMDVNGALHIDAIL